MNTIDPETAYPAIQKMLFSLAWRFSNAYPITYDEALSEAHMGFMKACQDYKPERGQKFSSWAYYWAWCMLKDLVMKRSADPMVCVEIDEDLAIAARPDRSELLDLVGDLSQDAQEIINLLLNVPTEIMEEMPRTPYQLMTKVKKHLTSAGRSREQIEAAHLEIKAAFQQAWTN